MITRTSVREQVRHEPVHGTGKKPSSAKTSTTAVVGVLVRTEFTTSRLAEFASVEELTKQIGHPPEDWPIAAVKELIDNSIDECERAGVAPVVGITVREKSITVVDNGGGIAPGTVERLLDFRYKTSSKAAYVSPTRGQQGNATQVLLATSHALDGKPGVVIIEARGVRHQITFTVDPISQEPILKHERADVPVTPGTVVTMSWPPSALSKASIGLYNAAIYFACVNPHLSLTFSSPARSWRSKATDLKWTKWKPTEPTSALWYSLEQMKRLIAAEVDKANRSGEPQRPVREFLADFRGLSSTVKRSSICEAVAASRLSLRDFFNQGEFALNQLLARMKLASRPVKPIDLGVIGREHVFAYLGGAISSQRYRRIEVDAGGVPYLVEAAFSWRPTIEGRTLVAALNWSIAVTGNPFDALGAEGEGLESLLAQRRAGAEEPIAVFVHVASPRLEFLDKGKSSVELPAPVDNAIIAAVKYITEAWTKQRKAEERNASALLRRTDALTAAAKPLTVKEVAYAGLARAYAAVSDNGQLPAEARQLYYELRPEILHLTQRDEVNAEWFTQGILIDYMNERRAETASWDVAFSDRGHFAEPHTGREIGLGTLAVRSYVKGYAKPKLVEAHFVDPTIETHGPEGRYAGLLYVEKEGFDHLLDQAQIARRFDLSIMSCKGMSVTAARTLVDETCARFKVPLYILHDFDISGFSIASTLHQSNRRYQFATASGEDFKVIDFGLRLADVERLGLASERVSLGKVSKDKLRKRLRTNGATEAEIEFLLDGPDGFGQRVELNAMRSRVFVDFLEAKLREHGAAKVIPSARLLEDTFRLFKRGAEERWAVEAALAALPREAIAAPADLEKRVRAHLTEHPEAAWDEAVSTLAPVSLLSGKGRHDDPRRTRPPNDC